MVYQTAMNGQRIDETAAGVGGNVANLASDLLSLTELQAKLALLDLRESTAQAVVPAATLAGAGCLALGAIPVLLLGLSGALAEAASISSMSAMLIVALAAIAIAGIGVWIGYNQVKDSLKVLNRSREEFEANLRWIKKAIQQSSPSKTWRP